MSNPITGSGPVNAAAVAAAITEIRAEGSRESVNRIIRKLGRGSSSTVTLLLREYREKEAKERPATERMDQLPSAVLDRIKSVIAGQAEELFGLLSAPIDEREAELQRDTAAQLQAMQIDLDSAAATAIRLESEKAAAETAAQELRQQIAKLTEQVQESGRNLAEARSAHSDEIRRLNDEHLAALVLRDNIIDTQRHDLEVARVAAGASAARADALDAQVAQLDRAAQAQRAATEKAEASLAAERGAGERAAREHATEREASRAERQRLVDELAQAQNRIEAATAELRAKLGDAISEAAELRGRLAALTAPAAAGTKAVGKKKPKAQ